MWSFGTLILRHWLAKAQDQLQQLHGEHEIAGVALVPRDGRKKKGSVKQGSPFQNHQSQYCNCFYTAQRYLD